MDKSANTDKYESIYQDLCDTPILSSYENKIQLSNKDPFQTQEQELRDQSITILLREYVCFFKDRKEENKQGRKEIKYFCFLSVILLLVIIFSIVSLTIIHNVKDISVVAVIISSIIGLFGSIFGLIKYVAMYSFPVEDEKYVTDIVKAIQENDFKHKHENFKISQALKKDNQD